MAALAMNRDFRAEVHGDQQLGRSVSPAVCAVARKAGQDGGVSDNNTQRYRVAARPRSRATIEQRTRAREKLASSGAAGRGVDPKQRPIVHAGVSRRDAKTDRKPRRKRRTGSVWVIMGRFPQAQGRLMKRAAHAPQPLIECTSDT